MSLPENGGRNVAQAAPSPSFEHSRDLAKRGDRARRRGTERGHQQHEMRARTCWSSPGHVYANSAKTEANVLCFDPLLSVRLFIRSLYLSFTHTYARAQSLQVCFEGEPHREEIARHVSLRVLSLSLPLLQPSFAGSDRRPRLAARRSSKRPIAVTTRTQKAAMRCFAPYRTAWGRRYTKRRRRKRQVEEGSPPSETREAIEYALPAGIQSSPLAPKSDEGVREIDGTTPV